ncbi:hypothetical protein ABTG83_19430, partial [Acinetobacter baumannii]
SPTFDIAGQPPVLRIEPGERTRVSSVSIVFDGDLAGEGDERAARRAALRAGWRLAEGQPFRQADWSAAKQTLLEDLTARDYAAAVMGDSRAEVDPD